MLHKIGVAFAVIVNGTTPALTGAAAATSGVSGAVGFGHGSGQRSGSVAHFGTPTHLGGIGPRLGSGPHGAMGHEGSGWYHRGWGGTLDPGWGYGFGHNLGGSGH